MPGRGCGSWPPDWRTRTPDPAMLCDAHNHLQDEWLDPHREAIVAELRAVGVGAAVVNGTEEADWQAVAALADAHPWVIPNYGLHPWRVAGRTPEWRNRLIACLDREAAAGRPHGIGEIGLDRWKKPYDFADQQAVFLAQMAVAAERNLPASIHCLEAWGALDDLLHRHPVPARGFLLHAYGGPLELVERFAARGAYFTFNGYFLHERKAARREVFRQVPAGRLLIETDAPAMPPPAALTRYSLPPAPDGTALHHPASLADVYPALAALRGIGEDALVRQVAENFQRLFGADPLRGNQLPAGGLPWNRCPS